MIELLTQDGLRPFLISAGLVIGLLILELVLASLGLSGDSGADAPEVDSPEVDADFAGVPAADIAADLNVDLQVATQIEAEISAQSPGVSFDDGVTQASDAAGGTSAFGTLLDLMGMRLLPLSVSLALFCAGFAAAGMSVQVILFGILGFMLPSLIMVPIALVIAAFLTRRLSKIVVRLIPREETSAISERSLGRRRGTVVVGTARAGHPAQVKVVDGYGNPHYLMVEPLAADDEITEGAEVIVLRLRGGEYRLVQVG